MVDLVDQTTPSYNFCCRCIRQDAAANPNWTAFITSSTHSAADVLPTRLSLQYPNILFGTKHTIIPPTKETPFIFIPDSKHAMSAFKKSCCGEHFFMHALAWLSWWDGACLMWRNNDKIFEVKKQEIHLCFRVLYVCMVHAFILIFYCFPKKVNDWSSSLFYYKSRLQLRVCSTRLVRGHSIESS